jgi:hypothetical protein
MLLSSGWGWGIVAHVRLPSPVGVIGDVAGSVARTTHDVALGTLDVVLASSFALEVVDRVVSSPLVDRTAQRLLTGPEVERLLDMALRSERVEQLLSEALESRLVDETITRLVEDTITRLLASESLWVLIDEVAASPAITEAITQHGVGFADQVADEVRERSRHADAWMETIARRLLRRRAARMATPEIP